MDRYIVVSSDCHVGLPMAEYREYLDPQYREIMDTALPIETRLSEKASESFLIKEINEEWRRGIEDGLTGAWIHEERIKVLDGDGIAAEVMFPDGVTEMNSPPFGAGIGLSTAEEIVPELQWAGARAHNRWLAEFCSEDPERHVGLAIVPVVWDPQEAVLEARWAAENGLKGVVLPNLTRHHKGYNHTCYHPFWEACEDLGLIVHYHSGGAPHEQFFGTNWPEESPEDHVGAVGAYVSEVLWWTYRPLSFMIWGGVFERFPKLKTIVTETGTCWMVPHWLKLLDHMYHDVQFSRKMGNFCRHLSLSPSEYFKRNVGIGASCIARADAEERHKLGLTQIMWGSDYPHPEGSWPHSREQMVQSFTGMPDDEIAMMLGEKRRAVLRSGSRGTAGARRACRADEIRIRAHLIRKYNNARFHRQGCSDHWRCQRGWSLHCLRSGQTGCQSRCR